MTTPRDDIAGRGTHTVHDPFLKRDVEVSSKLPDRLRGKYAKGPTMPDGEPEFGWSQFETPPIQHEAADALDVAATQLDSLLKERFKLITDLADMKSRAISAEQERDALQARVKELESGIAHAHYRSDNCDAENQSLYDRLEAVESRATRIQQERDEAYERAATIAKDRAVKLRAKAKSLKQPHSQHYFAQAIEASVIETAIRRLAGPEKEKKE